VTQLMYGRLRGGQSMAAVDLRRLMVFLSARVDVTFRCGVELIPACPPCESRAPSPANTGAVATALPAISYPDRTGAGKNPAAPGAKTCSPGVATK